MVRPRWQGHKKPNRHQFWERWNQGVALIAAANISWIIFDLSYIPLRGFWINKEIKILPANSIVINLKWIPNFTNNYDKIKGIEAHLESKEYIQHFTKLDKLINKQGISSQEAKESSLKHIRLTQNLINNNPSGISGEKIILEKVKSRLRNKAGKSNFNEASNYLLSENYLSNKSWESERKFWSTEIIPLISTNYVRSTNDNGKPFDSSWQIDLPFQLLFILDIFLRALRIKFRLPAISWRDAFLRRWIDIPLLIPFWRILRIVPITERLSNSKLIQLEPIRVVISQWIVALLAVEIFEIFTIRVVDSAQVLISSPDLPSKVRSLCSYRTAEERNKNNLIALIRIWLPILLKQIGPSLRPQLIELFSYALQKSMENPILPSKYKNIDFLEKAELSLSNQIASGMIDTLLGISKNAGTKFNKEDKILERLGTNTTDKFWEELAAVLDNEEILEKSQELFLIFLEDIKRTSFKQLKQQRGVDELITELDGLNFSSEGSETNNQV